MLREAPPPMRPCGEAIQSTYLMQNQRKRKGGKEKEGKSDTRLLLQACLYSAWQARQQQDQTLSVDVESTGQGSGRLYAPYSTAPRYDKRNKGVGTTMHPRDRLARRPVSIKLGLLTLSSRETRDCRTPPDRGVLPHRGEGRINHQVVALTIKVQRHKIPRSCEHPNTVLVRYR